jgi:hypothetical protein
MFKALIIKALIAVGLLENPEAIKKENAELKARVTRIEKEQAEWKEGEGSQNTAPPAVITAGYQPPAQPERGMRQSWGYLVPPKGCEAPYLAKVSNDTDTFAAAAVDGENIAIRGPRGPLPNLIRPRSAVFICLNDVGTHTFEAVLYAARPLTTGTHGKPPAELKQVGSCKYTGTYSFSSLQGTPRAQLVTFNRARSCAL